MEERIVELELRSTEQQQLLGELSDVLYAQGKALERLQAEVAVLRERLAGEPGLVDSTVIERPPHY
jgi:SlyX protein